MEKYDVRLHELQSLIDGKLHAEAVLKDLCDQKRILEKKVWELNHARMSEQSDVDRLEGTSLRSVILGVLGKKEERLEKERAELAAAILKRDLAQKELDALEAMIAEKRQILNRCVNAETEYERLLCEKAEQIGRKGGSDAQEIDGLRRRIAELKSHCTELSEALNAGRKAEQIANDALDSLGSTDTWGTLDLFCDSMIFDIAKYGAMDSAKSHIEQLQFQMRLFRAELADIAMDASAEMENGGMFQFADFFFDDIFTAFSTLNRVDRAKNSVETALRRIFEALRAVEEQMQVAQLELSDLQDQLRNKILNTKA